MEIAAFQKESFIDYPEKISTVVFFPKCNYRCSGCHAKNILTAKDRISEKEFFDYIDSKKDWIGGVVLCGGEPTLAPDLIDFAKKVKKKGFSVKLDTNGSTPDILSKLLKENIIDYIAMDVKAPKELYPEVAGVKTASIDLIEKSIKIVSQFPNYEFRTTVVPVIRKKGEISFLTIQEIENTAKWIVKITGSNKHKYFLQSFVPRENELLDKRLEKLSETPKDLLKQMHDAILKHLPNAKIR